MNDFSLGEGPFLLPVLIAAAVIFALIIWFFVNRASVRANEQVHLLEALLREQKKQNALLKQLVTLHTPPEAEITGSPTEESLFRETEENGYMKFVPER
ncbi:MULTISPECIES: YebO family protein [Tatumella]|uniref:YebO family protein n=1 Tax=Tatumella punctata TaxID=399969 RepID=A0ABW1VL43_9GAMM|nr:MULTISPECIES: YebO family protein [unclassified Tatumella]MBS0855380.1 YebO family protein [Tatumella sp. JGM16]MBS0877250.1 YebO family protein [Tatumella sp. JGM82]MBS0889381.1 YebO family protein [Tatumella sp. JGM94]MBS0901647.1 YebO family protein [Tatumella sp. JGM100]MBS0911614.1 YebO family protein [Tatumella sp. JGM91]